ncbi:hypothetical protein MIR68_002067 [Amoeboaphelidium protococcarum]|nr:hypothetical protein MIR68_002067 [Amoeboaphelidium protococcarum]
MPRIPCNPPENPQTHAELLHADFKNSTWLSLQNLENLTQEERELVKRVALEKHRQEHALLLAQDVNAADLLALRDGIATLRTGYANQTRSITELRTMMQQMQTTMQQFHMAQQQQQVMLQQQQVTLQQQQVTLQQINQKLGNARVVYADVANRGQEHVDVREDQVYEDPPLRRSPRNY